MTIFAWIILGLVAGVIASKIIHKEGEGFALDLVLGIGGAFIGGLLFHQFGTTGTAGANIWSMVFALLGAIGTLSVTRAIVGKGHAHT